MFKPAVLKKMAQSKWDWWGNTDAVLDELMKTLAWLNPAGESGMPAEAVKGNNAENDRRT